MMTNNIGGVKQNKTGVRDVLTKGLTGISGLTL